MSRYSVILAVVLVAMIGSSSAFITGCTTLGAPVNGEQRCATCSIGYVLANGGALCNICPLGCSSCDAFNNCQTCSAGTYLFQGQCLSCSVGCAQCSVAACVVCAAGYTLDNNQCIACIPNCDKCTRNGECQTCREDYKLTKNTQGQQQCLFSNERDASPGIILWLLVLFIVCCCPFIFLCCFLFPPSSHEGVPSSGYAPIEQPRARVAEIPAQTTGVRQVTTTETKTTTMLPGSNQFGPGKGNTVLTPGTF